MAINRRDFAKTAMLGAIIHDAAAWSDRPTMAPVSFDRHCWRIGGQAAFLVSGEFHYFRVPKADWKRRMSLLKEAGGNAIATYVPWGLHEPTEGQFVFSGQGGILDLEEFLETAREAGLYVIARPGPYVYSELNYDGLPAWLTQNYPQVLAHDADGKPFHATSVSYVHPLFLEKARRWYEHAGPILARHTVSKGGAIALTQVDNELSGIHVWYDSLDYNAEAMGYGRAEGRYPRYLRQRYGDIAGLNSAWNTKFVSFEAIQPVRPGASDVGGLRRAKDNLDFYLGTVAEYAATLAGWLRQMGVSTPIVHNAGGPSMNANYLEMCRALGANFVLGSDHYYNGDQTWPQNAPTPQFALNAFVSLEQLRLFGYPPTVFEIPGGSPSDWPPIVASDALACYRANLAFGMKGSNYYVFTGGPNPPRMGQTTDIYDFCAGIGAQGEIRPLYAAEKEFGKALESNPWLAEAEREFDCRVAVDPEQARANLYWKSRGEFEFSSAESDEFLHKGVLTSALCASESPVLCDIRSDEWTADRRTPVVVVASSAMRREAQQRVVNFLKSGGKVLLLPVLPATDENFQPCTILADYLGAAIEHHKNEVPRTTILGVENILSNGRQWRTVRMPQGAEAVGSDEFTQATLAWRLATPAGGQVLFLGMSWIHAMRQHGRMVRAALGRLGLEEKVSCSNPNVWTSLRTSGPKSLLFAINLFNAPMEAEIQCRPSWSDHLIALGKRTIPAMTVSEIEVR